MMSCYKPITTTKAQSLLKQWMGLFKIGSRLLQPVKNGIQMGAKKKTVKATIYGLNDEFGEYRLQGINGGLPIITRATGGPVPPVKTEDRGEDGGSKKKKKKP